MIDLKELIQDQSYKFADVELGVANAVQSYMAETFGAKPENIYSTVRLSLDKPIANVENNQIVGLFSGRLMWKRDAVMVTEGFPDKLREFLGQSGSVVSLDSSANLVKYELEVPIVEFGSYVKEEPAPEPPAEETPAEEPAEPTAEPPAEEKSVDEVPEEVPPKEDTPKEPPPEKEKAPEEAPKEEEGT